MKRLKPVLVLAIIMLAVLTSGCATRLGRHYGEVGAIGCGAIGGAAGGIEGAIIGSAACALGGGLIGDEVERQERREERHYDRHEGYRGGRDSGGGYVRPCRRVRVPVYDEYADPRYDDPVGYREVCE